MLSHLEVLAEAGEEVDCQQKDMAPLWDLHFHVLGLVPPVLAPLLKREVYLQKLHRQQCSIFDLLELMVERLELPLKVALMAL